ncbi:MAG: flagellar biosynthesis protein FliQ [Candidatus Jordarchaeum sp.]|uniref:flagellar biosynthesis protein FliQ n=1 Tax=Candidatus Jordarchaeum sp. TaxID=2823881 RepID=UPI0040498F78
MTQEFVIGITKNALEITLMISLPILAVGLIVGIVVALFQAITQMHEMTLTFVPKIVAVFITILFLFPWMMQKMVFYTQQLIMNLPKYIH